MNLKGRNFLTLKDYTPEEIIYLLDLAAELKSLKKELGITSKVLSAVLKELEEDGIISRAVIDDTPVRVEYSLTDEGITMKPFLTEMFKWGNDYLLNRNTPGNS